MVQKLSSKDTYLSVSSLPFISVLIIHNLLICLKKPLFEQEEGVKGRLHRDVYRTEFGHIGFHSHTKEQRHFAFEKEAKEHLWLYVAVLYGNPNIAITVGEYFPIHILVTDLLVLTKM